MEEKKTSEVEEVLETEQVEEVKEEVKELTEVEKLQLEVADYKDKWMRNVAEFDNYKKRNASLYSSAYFEGKKDAITKLLVIGDNLETAIPMITDEKSRQGVELLLKQFKDALTNMGVTEIDPTGKPFDPENSEAVMQAEGADGEESGTVKMTFQKGYKADDKIIRYAKVSVVK